MRQCVIFTADDFGMSHEVNEAIVEAHLNGVLNATSLMVGGPAKEHAVRLAKMHPTLRVGLHLALIDGWVATQEEFPLTLTVDGRRLRKDMTRLSLEIVYRKKVRSRIVQEIEQQFIAFRDTGLTMDHVNAHKHFHVHPFIAAAVVQLGQKYGLKGVRVPLEPRALMRRIDRRSLSKNDLLLLPWAKRLHKLVQRHELFSPDFVFGLSWTGQLHTERLESLLKALPAGISEIYFHPATTNTFPDSVHGYDYRAEFQALCSPKVLDLKKALRLKCGGYEDIRRLSLH